MTHNLIKRKLLIVEDNQAARILIKEILGHLNVTIIETGFAEEAICLFKIYHSDIALVLLDLRLPNWDGCELLKQFRSIDPCVPAIAVSALRPIELAARAKQAGFEGWMEKPMDIEGFIEIVSSYL
jgi:two-component system cell cycle response regulator DivK